MGVSSTVLNMRPRLSVSHSYLNIFEESDLKIEEDFFKAHPSMGTFHNKVIVGTVIPPPQHDLSVIKVCW